MLEVTQEQSRICSEPPLFVCVRSTYATESTKFQILAKPTPAHNSVCALGMWETAECGRMSSRVSGFRKLVVQMGVHYAAWSTPCVG